MLKLLVRLVLLTALLSWLTGAAIVMLVDPDAPSGRLLAGLDAGETSAQVLGYHGYVHRRRVQVGEGPDAETVQSVLVRGALDRAAASFPLSLDYARTGGERLQAVELAWAGEAADIDDPRAWHVLVRVRVLARDGRQRGRIEQVRCPAGATHYRVGEIVAGARRGGFAASLPRAPGVLGRLHDAIGSWLPFRWLPSLR